MEGLIASHGGRILKAGLLAFGALIWAAPVFAQDPLAPISDDQAAQAPGEAPATPQLAPVTAPPPPGTPIVAVPRDWRGVFDAIYSGDWAAARAGTAALPPSVITPVAKAELYTAKNSPVVDLASIQALLAEAPDLPQASQLAAMAVRRGSLTAPLIVPTKPLYNLGSAPVRYRARPVSAEPYADALRSALEPFVKANDHAG